MTGTQFKTIMTVFYTPGSFSQLLRSSWTHEVHVVHLSMIVLLKFIASSVTLTDLSVVVSSLKLVCTVKSHVLFAVSASCFCCSFKNRWKTLLRSERAGDAGHGRVKSSCWEHLPAAAEKQVDETEEKHWMNHKSKSDSKWLKCWAEFHAENFLWLKRWWGAEVKSRASEQTSVFFQQHESCKQNHQNSSWWVKHELWRVKLVDKSSLRFLFKTPCLHFH